MGSRTRSDLRFNAIDRPTSPNTVIAVNPLTAKAGSPVPAGNNPNLLSVSADGSYLWVGLDGSAAVQRFQLPGFQPRYFISCSRTPLAEVPKGRSHSKPPA